jgi:hypothetical protein
MEEITELKKLYNLEENSEYIIIPFTSAGGKRKRCFLLKRRFIRIAYKDGRYIDYTLAEAIEALLKYPDMKLSEALRLIHGADAERRIIATQAILEAETEQPGSGLEDGNEATGRALQA